MIVAKLFEIRQQRISLKSVNYFLNYNRKKQDIDEIYQILVAESISKFSSEGKISFVENYQTIWQTEKSVEPKEEEKSAEDIISEVFKKRNIKIKGEA